MKTVNKYLILCFLASLSCYIAFSQEAKASNDTINQCDSLGYKHGYWIQYLSKHFQVVKKREAAVYYFYTQYLHGVNFDCWFNRTKYYLSKKDSTSYHDEPILLDGIYKFYLKKKSFFKSRDIEKVSGCTNCIKNGVLSGEYIFKKGVLQLLRTGEDMRDTLFFEDKYKQHKYSYRLKTYSESGIIQLDRYVFLDDSEGVKNIFLKAIRLYPEDPRSKVSRNPVSWRRKRCG